jgi:hypothetical protein
MLLELIAGLLGWVWIIASLAALVYFVLAILSRGRWSMFFWAVGISVVAKWLSRGFTDNQIRVQFEAKKIEEEMSREEAAKNG